MKHNFILDSNVFIRLVVRDIEFQHREAVSLFEKIEKNDIVGKVSLLVVNETVWILEKFYGMERKVYIPIILNLLLLANIKIIEIKKAILVEILQLMMESKFDFTDLYLSRIATKKTIFSFDKDFKKIYKEN